MTIPDNSHAYTPVAKAVPIDGDLGDTLIPSPAETVSPDATAYLEVVAPATLPEVSILCSFFVFLYLPKQHTYISNTLIGVYI